MRIQQALLGAGVAVVLMLGSETGSTRHTEASLMPATSGTMAAVKATMRQAVVLSRDAVLVVVLDTAGELKACIKQVL